MRYNDDHLSQGGCGYNESKPSIFGAFLKLILVIIILFVAAYFGLHAAGMIK